MTRGAATALHSRREGFALAQLLVIVAALSTLVLTLAMRQTGTGREVRNGYHDAAALALAHGGVEAALAGIHRGVPTDGLLIPSEVRLTEAVGYLDVSLEPGPATEQVVVRSCALVVSSRQRPDVRPSRRCVVVSVRAGPEPRVVDWRETAPVPRRAELP